MKYIFVLLWKHYTYYSMFYIYKYIYDDAITYSGLLFQFLVLFIYLQFLYNTEKVFKLTFSIFQLIVDFHETCNL